MTRATSSLSSCPLWIAAATIGPAPRWITRCAESDIFHPLNNIIYEKINSQIPYREAAGSAGAPGAECRSGFAPGSTGLIAPPSAPGDDGFFRSAGIVKGHPKPDKLPGQEPGLSGTKRQTMEDGDQRLDECGDDDAPALVTRDDDLVAEPVQITVEARAHGWRLDHYLSRLFPNYSRAEFQRAITSGAITHNGLVVKPSRRLRVNDRLSVSLPPQPEEGLLAEDIPISILYEDDELAVIDKPADMVTHPGKSHFRGTLAAAVQFHFDSLSSSAGQLRPGIVHRLDRDTTGVIVIAKNNQTHHRLSGQFERREVIKEYRALVRGEIDRQTGVIDTWLRVHPRAREKMIACEPGEGARHAVTYYEVLERFDGFSYVKLLPKTGRTHQLRVHLQSLGHPIVADRAYGGHRELKLSELTRSGSLASDRIDTDDTLISRQALHAFRLQIRHPVTERELVFQADLPEDMQRTLDALRQYRAVRKSR